MSRCTSYDTNIPYAVDSSTVYSTVYVDRPAFGDLLNRPWYIYTRSVFIPFVLCELC